MSRTPLLPRPGSSTTPTAARARRTTTSPSRAAAARPLVAGVGISNADRPIAGAPGATKLDLARYYAAVARWFMPQIADRPLALVKCPGGDFRECFFQKHGGDPRRARERAADDPPWMHLATLEEAIGAVQFGAIEFHTWGARFPRLDRPDRLILDLDPDPAVDWAQFRDAAERVRALLDGLGLVWFVKTTGGKGLHFVVPLLRRHAWDELKSFAAALARRLVADAPALFIATAGKAQRKGLVFVDWLRNADGATAVAAYALRARAGLPVSMPIAWSELDADVRAAHFNWRNVPALLAQRTTDPWAGYGATRQAITAAQRRAVGA